MCAEYIAPGINALPENDEYKEYSDEYENADDDQRTKEKGTLFRKELVRPVQWRKFKCNEKHIFAKQFLFSQKGAILCPNRSDFCFSLWRTDQNGSVVIVRQGCWQTERPESCQNSRCISDKPKSSTKSHRFCCCSDQMCNANITTTEYAEVNV